MATQPHINAIGTAVPAQDIHAAFVDWARARLPAAEAKLFDRMAARSGIGHRWSVLPDPPVAPGGFYAAEPHPGTAARMALYAGAAPVLALAAIADLATRVSTGAITHLVVASCTGFVAPGIDQRIAAALGLSPAVERTLVGFMGCYAAVAALRTARHIVRSEPEARVLVVTVELSTLHLQAEDRLEPLLAMLQFGDGAAAALVTADAVGLPMGRPFATTLPDSDALIRWDITDRGFAMHLSGEVPGRIAAALRDSALVTAITGGRTPDAWAVHAGGRSILDAVAIALDLPTDALDASRRVLADNGNMSSATLMFVLARLLERPVPDYGIALAFGPGLAAEGFAFGRSA
ncbi:MAG: type III polyketide synthase [Sphingomonas adhaesiva]|uniref:type III polyketide synthase n=1 Tax=Sphingomonas adhaesiva TaxID=28212 RepID=UPI002FFAA1BD